jgi:hypothetical protein
VFVSGVVYMADAVGTQTEALLIRGLSAGVAIRRVARREVATGVAIGIAVAVAFFPFALAVWGEGRLALAVSLALLASCSIATLVAMFLPWLFQRLDVDPAFGSGPLATVYPGSALDRRLLRGGGSDRRRVSRRPGGLRRRPPPSAQPATRPPRGRGSGLRG